MVHTQGNKQAASQLKSEILHCQKQGTKLEAQYDWYHM